MNATLENLLDRIRSWPPGLQAEAERVLLAIEGADVWNSNEAGLTNSDEVNARLKRAYAEGMASGPGREVDLNDLLETFRGRATERG